VSFNSFLIFCFFSFKEATTEFQVALSKAMHWQLLFATASVGRAGDVALEIESRNAKAYAMMAEAAQNLKILANRMLVHAGVDASSMQRSIATAARSFENVGSSDYPPAHDVVAELPAFSIPTLATEPASPASYNAWAAPPIAEPAVMLPPAATATATAAVASAYTSLMSTAAPAATAPTAAAAAVPTATGTGTATPTANRLGGDRGSLRVPIVSTACGSSNDESHKVGRCDFVSDDKPETRWSCGSKGSDCWVAVSFGTAPHTLAALQIDFESANSDEYVLTVATSPIDASRPLDATWILVENHHNDGDWYRGAHQLDEFNLTPARTAVYGVRLQHVSGTYESNSIWQIRAFSTPLDIVAKPKEATEPVDAQCRIGHQTPFALCAAHRVANGGGTSYKYDHRQPRASQTGATSHPTLRKIDGIEGVREEAARAGSGVEIVAEMPQGHWVQTQMYDGQMFLRYLPDRKNAICSWASNHPLEWHPALGCPGAQAPYSQQKCGNVAAVVKVKCAYIAGQGQCGASCAGTVHDEKRWFHRDHSQQPPLSCNAKKGARYWPKLAATMSVNPTDVGHFVPQVVPRIIIMNASVPEDVLITVITTPLVERYLGPLFRSGALDKKRFLLMPQEKMNDIELHGGEVYQMYNSHFQHLGSGIGEGLAVHKACVFLSSLRIST